MNIDDLRLGEIRRELLALTAQADLAAGNTTRNPSAVNGPDHPMPGPEWTVPTRTLPWTIRAAATVRDADCVYVCGPGHLHEDFVATDTASARALALALLAACDYADHVRAGLPVDRAVRAVDAGLRLVESVPQ